MRNDNVHCNLWHFKMQFKSATFNAYLSPLLIWGEERNKRYRIFLASHATQFFLISRNIKNNSSWISFISCFSHCIVKSLPSSSLVDYLIWISSCFNLDRKFQVCTSIQKYDKTIYLPIYSYKWFNNWGEENRANMIERD